MFAPEIEQFAAAPSVRPSVRPSIISFVLFCSSLASTFHPTFSSFPPFGREQIVKEEKNKVGAGGRAGAGMEWTVAGAPNRPGRLRLRLLQGSAAMPLGQVIRRAIESQAD